VTAFVSRNTTDAVTTETQSRSSIDPAHLPMADADSAPVQARVFF
jgi:hypothetical protein